MNRNRKTRNPKTQPHLPKDYATKPGDRARRLARSSKRGNAKGALLHKNTQ